MANETTTKPAKSTPRPPAKATAPKVSNPAAAAISTAAGEARSIPVGSVTFDGPQDGAGFSVRSSLTDRRHNSSAAKTSKWEIDYMPGIQFYKIRSYYDPEKPPMVSMIPKERVMYHVPFEPREAPKAKA